MCPEIEVDAEVYAYLQEHAEAFVDRPNDVLRRLLLTRGNTGKTAAVTSAESEGKAAQPHRTPTAKDAGTRKSRLNKGAKPKRSRAPSHALLPESEYEMPILFALERAGGRAAVSEVVAAVGEHLDEKFLPMDRETMDNGRQRWQMRTQFTRLRMVKAGLLEENAPRGVWVISDAGRLRLSKDAVAA
jgi:hypothetical protein